MPEVRVTRTESYTVDLDPDSIRFADYMERVLRGIGCHAVTRIVTTTGVTIHANQEFRVKVPEVET